MQLLENKTSKNYATRNISNAGQQLFTRIYLMHMVLMQDNDDKFI